MKPLKYTLIFLLLVFAFVSSASDGQLVTAAAPPALHNAKSISALAPTTRLNLIIGLPLRNRETLTNLLTDIYNPASPHYHHYLNATEFTDRFAPTADDYQAVMEFAKAHGLTITSTHANRTLLGVTAAVADIEGAFHVRMRYYQHPSEARTFFSADAEPSLDLSVPLLTISGLNDFVIPKPAGKPGSDFTSASHAAGTGPGGNYLGQDFRTAYAPGVSLNGSGQTVALLELDGYYTNDILDYQALAGITPVSITNVLVDGATGDPSSDADSVGEVSLDIEMVLAMAPGIAKLVVYEAPNCCNYWIDILNRMATDNQARQISTSWLVGNNPSADQVYQQMAAQGQSFFQCSGDYGAFYQGISQMADSTYFTTVGATTLTTGPGAAYSSETAWSNYADNQGVQSTGGGISWTYAIPEWQEGINMSANHGSTEQRNVPDVAMVGNRVWVISDNGSSNWWWGTSCAAPLWAGFAALINQQAADYGNPPIGFINPAIYALGKSANYASCFHDISTGNNTNSVIPTNYFAVTGYDLCTGWGTPKGAALINALAPNYSLRITPYDGFVSAGPIAGPFDITSLNFALTNITGTPLGWAISNSTPWLTVTPFAGTLPVGGETNVFVTLNSNAAQLTTGIYSATLWFTNASTGLAQTRQFQLHVAQPLLQNGDFETGNFAGWNVSGPLADTDISTNVLYAHSGLYGAKLGPAGGLAFFSQTIPTSPGQPYLVSCWLDSPNGDTPNAFKIVWDERTLYSHTNLPALGWTNLQFLAVATSNETLVRFGFHNEPSYFGFDDASVTPVPLPNFQSVTRTNSTVTFVWNTLAGLNYQLQFQTNLSSGQWVDLGTVLQATASTLATTDGTSGNQRFYRVKLVP